MKPYIHVEGEGKFALVLFHGWGYDSRIWRNLVTLLNASFRIYLVDLPGFGQTPFMDWQLFKQQLLARLPPKVALLGWSMGGLQATRLALEEPSRITHLINVASSPYFMEQPAWPGIEAGWFDAFRLNLLESPQATWEGFHQRYVNMADKPANMPHIDALKAGLKLLCHTDYRTKLIQLDMPTLYMFGHRDRIVPSKTCMAMQEAWPQFHYYKFTKSAHVPFLSEPVLFKQVLEEFIL